MQDDFSLFQQKPTQQKVKTHNYSTSNESIVRENYESMENMPDDSSNVLYRLLNQLFGIVKKNKTI